MVHRTQSKVVVVGIGNVGATLAYTLAIKGGIQELVLIDINEQKARGDMLDINHGLPLLHPIQIKVGDYSDCKDADIIVLTAGANQKPGETRIDLLNKNASIFKTMIHEITKHTTTAILLVATNPVDVLTYYTWKESGYPKEKVIGSGTVLDSARFRYLLSQKLDVDPRSVHAHIIGEHGDSELAVWSLANVGGVTLEHWTQQILTAEEKQDIYEKTRDAAYEIIQAKGATYYAIAVALDRIVRAILGNENAVLSVSSYIEDYYDVEDVFMGIPSIINRDGVKQVISLPLNEEEQKAFQASAKKIKDINRQLP
ncbi:L-lactate dehydrogenase [Desulfuribacillus stibiiarsenatis]|uniref:L-lactate dehydrogenase n=1 Tax=Desulfuribacillus stibiiarsenatis TaxID=1390249 RepID=A0A1E5L2E3_9FIRM|nr:L-lactate dehydrogenase [Desulfuribacillus stibiiarsenatis]OEH84276.1 L-lactate dehydrogenase [Desulfuribacillus stibiiarsenatis]